MAIKITNVLKLETDGVTLPVAVLRKWLEEIVLARLINGGAP